MPDYSAEIAEIDALLDAGQTEISVDGLRTRIDLEALRRRRRELAAVDTASVTAGLVRPTAFRINVGAAW